MEIVGRLTRNAGFVFIAGLAEKTFFFFSFAYAARILGPADFGVYALIGTFMFFIDMFSAFGVNPLAVREISRRKEQAEEIFSRLFSLKFLFVLIAYPVVVLSAYGLGYGDRCRNLIHIAGVTAAITAMSGTFGVLYMGLEMFMVPSVVKILVSFLHAASNVVVLYLGYGLEGMVWVALLGSVAGLAISAVWVRRKIIPYRFRFDFAPLKDLFLQSVPFSFLAFFQQAQSYLTILLLSVLPGPLEGKVAVGYYNPSLSIGRAVMMIPGGFHQAAMPAVSANADDREIVTSIINSATQTFLPVIIFPLILATTFFPREIITLVFGPAYLPSARALTILGWAFSLQVFNAPVTATLAASREIRRFVPWAGLVFCISIVLCVPLVIYYSFVGAAVAYLVSMIVETIIRHHLLRVVWGIRTTGTQNHLLKSALVIAMACLALGVARSFAFGSPALLVMAVLLYAFCVMFYAQFREGVLILVNGMIGRRLARNS